MSVSRQGRIGKLRAGQSKKALKELAEWLGVPGAFHQSTQTGFRVANHPLVPEEIDEWNRAHLPRAAISARGYCNPSGVSTMLEQRRGCRDNSRSLLILGDAWIVAQKLSRLSAWRSYYCFKGLFRGDISQRSRWNLDGTPVR